MEVWFIILISLCACFSLKSLFSFFSSTKTTKKNVSQGNLPPGPPTLPFIGNLHLLPKSMVDLRSVMYDLSQKYGPILTVYLGSEPLIFITSYTLAHQVLVRHGATFANRPAVVPVSSVLSNNHKDIGGSPFGPSWKALRRNLLSEVLHPTSLKSYSVERKRVLDSLLKGLHESSKLNQPVRSRKCKRWRHNNLTVYFGLRQWVSKFQILNRNKLKLGMAKEGLRGVGEANGGGGWPRLAAWAVVGGQNIQIEK
ncbi:hypothetical protein F2P56_030926 [Juglans regia]|uniref:Uncharacterized protein n=1 Tax=Juglans regia TaxID=51240 RepID=A0A833TM19_JUGRE|nr:hypothetical protein F2P56_030926 [Juglans regia]